MAEPAGTILVVDDEADLRELLRFRFREAGYEVMTASTAGEALSSVARRRPNVVLLDWMLPDMPGTEVCKRLRAAPATKDIPIIMLTARGEEVDRVVGLELGADDYVTKPFSVRELLLRVRVLTRRAGEKSAPATAETMRWRGLHLDLGGHRLLVDGDDVQLTPIEFKLLVLFVSNPGRAYTREKLLDDVWNITADVTTRTVDTHVKRLREKLGVYGDAIETVRGIGYRLKEA
jgi:two-component system phosphate regulon response regulator PhoB